ncbi:MAG: hypothetical protein BRD46_04460 [Bacteroidetes bacterium QS_8_68_15]|nr:MAG: hypothetical protein BRD46_04460 [Bacteroidetes bacterium QS_8_68_15]
MRLLLLVHAGATLMMLGVILVVQVVHYPLFAQVGAANYAGYQKRHMRRITVVVLPTMSVELITAAWLAFAPPPAVPAWTAWTGLALAVLIWASTGLVQTPLHRRLADGFDARAHRRLVRTNALRTVAWAARGALALWMLARTMKA